MSEDRRGDFLTYTVVTTGWRDAIETDLKRVDSSDVKRGQNLEAEAEANFWRLRPRPRPKTIMKKYQITINNIRFKIIAEKN